MKLQNAKARFSFLCIFLLQLCSASLQGSLGVLSSVFYYKAPGQRGDNLQPGRER